MPSLTVIRGVVFTLLTAPAAVIKIEAPGEGDHSRGWGPPFVNGESSYFLSVNRNKRSVALDLKSEAGRKAAVLLATACDVLVENLRPGTAARLGLGYEDLKRLHPGLVYCAISGFGSDSQFEKFCAAIGEPKLARDARFATNRDRQARRQELNMEVEAALGRRTTAEWQAELERAGVPAGPILDLGQVFADPGVHARGVEVSVEHPDAGTWRMVGTPWRLDGTRFQVRRPPPRLGEHTAEVLAEVAGLSADQ